MKLRAFVALFLLLPGLARAFSQASPQILSRIAFGSCNHQDEPQPMWPVITQNSPDVWLWLGDVVYADAWDLPGFASIVKQQRSQPDYVRFLSSKMDVLGTWDDHDFGQNNGGRENPNRRQIQQLFLDFLGEPSNSARRVQEGIYASYTYGPPGKQIKFLLLDARYHRDLPGPNGDMLGESQWQWLEKELIQSTAQFHILVSGIQVLAQEHPYEKWANHPASYKRLMGLIRKHKPAGLLLLSGDRHIAEISALPAKESGLAQPLYDLTSSGLTHSYESFPGEPNSRRVGKVFTQRNFGLLEVNWSSPVKLRAEIRDQQNRVIKFVEVQGH